MENDKKMRFELVQLLTESRAHAGYQAVIKDFPMDRINDLFPNGEYDAWKLLEHMRLTQNDIWEFIVNPDYQEKEWPKDFWPDKEIEATPEMWQATVDGFIDDQRKLVGIINDLETDILEKIPWGSGQTILTEILTAADHNSYHIGEFGIMRQVMDTWRL